MLPARKVRPTEAPVQVVEQLALILKVPGTGKWAPHGVIRVKCSQAILCGHTT